jgi:hypothetical protein
MRAVYVGVAIAMLALSACNEHDYSRPNTTQEQFSRDVANCQRQVDTMVARDRNIDSDINSTLGAQSQGMNQGNTQLRQQMDARSSTSRTSKLMENCMSARGYTPASRGVFSSAPPPAAAPAKQ